MCAEIDPLHDDDATLADALEAAGVQTELKEYKGVTHEFFGMGAVVADAKGRAQLLRRQAEKRVGPVGSTLEIACPRAGDFLLRI